MITDRPIDWLNYQHLLYFWMASHSDTLAEAAHKLHLTSPTISTQIRKLETTIGHQLLVPRGRTLELTDVGRLVQRYADEIFGLGSELAEALAGRTPGGIMHLRVGIADAVPKLIVHRLLTPVLREFPTLRLQCSEAHDARLIERLATHHLDVVIADTRLSDSHGRRVFHHLLGESGTSFFSSPQFVNAFCTDTPHGFPPLADLVRSGATLLLPGHNAALRRQLDEFFDRHELQPSVAHEFEDTALMKVFGEEGAGIFPAPSVIETSICNQYNVICVAQVPDIRESFYAITAERHIRHPAVERLADCYRQQKTE